jgi:hypothetical protein
VFFPLLKIDNIKQLWCFVVWFASLLLRLLDLNTNHLFAAVIFITSTTHKKSGISKKDIHKVQHLRNFGHQDKWLESLLCNIQKPGNDVCVFLAQTTRKKYAFLKFNYRYTHESEPPVQKAEIQ